MSDFMQAFTKLVEKLIQKMEDAQTMKHKITQGATAAAGQAMAGG